MSIHREDNIPEEDQMATVDTESLVQGLQLLGGQLEKVIQFHSLRQADAEKKTGNQLFHKTDLDDGDAAERLKAYEAEAIEMCERIEGFKGNAINNTNSQS